LNISFKKKDSEIEYLVKTRNERVSTLLQEKTAEIEKILREKNAEIERVRQGKDEDMAILIRTIVNAQLADLETIRAEKEVEMENFRKWKEEEIRNLKIERDSAIEMLQNQTLDGGVPLSSTKKGNDFQKKWVVEAKTPRDFSGKGKLNQQRGWQSVSMYLYNNKFT